MEPRKREKESPKTGLNSSLPLWPPPSVHLRRDDYDLNRLPPLTPPPPATSAEVAIRRACVGSSPPNGWGFETPHTPGPHPRQAPGPHHGPRSQPPAGPSRSRTPRFRPPMGEGPRPYKRRPDLVEEPMARRTSASPWVPPPGADGVPRGIRGAYTRLPMPLPQAHPQPPPRLPRPSLPSPARSPYALPDDTAPPPPYTPQPAPPSPSPTPNPTTPMTRTDYRSLVDRFEALTRECQRLSVVVDTLARAAPPSPLATPPGSPRLPTPPPACPPSPPPRLATPPHPPRASPPRLPDTPRSPPRRGRDRRSRWGSDSPSRSRSPGRAPARSLSPLQWPSTPPPLSPIPRYAFSDDAHPPEGEEEETESVFSADVL